MNAGSRITARDRDGDELVIETWTEHEYPDAIDDAASACLRMWAQVQAENVDEAEVGE